MEIVIVPAQSEQVLIVKLDGTSRPVGPLPAGTTPELAVWSPDGTAITVFGKTKNGGEASLYLVTISTGQVRRATLFAEYRQGLEYSTDGERWCSSRRAILVAPVTPTAGRKARS